MYGLVNKAVQGLICDRFGEETWNRILEESGVDIADFVAMQAYDDQITLDLVATASRVLDAPADGLLEAFGEYWTIYTAEEGYGSLLDSTGNTLTEFLANLDNLHTRVSLAMPDLRPPSFEYEEVSESLARLHYRSEREGLSPMVIGLLKGLSVRFKTPIDIKLVEDRSKGSEHDVFEVRILD